MTSIPIVDVSPSIEGRPDGSVVAAVRAAMAEVGFFQAVGHGVSPGVIDAAYDAIDAIDAMSAAERAALFRPRATSRGVFEELDASGSILNRGFQFAPYDDLAAAEEAGAIAGHPDYFPPNVWPPGDRFRQTWKDYEASTRTSARALMSLFARAFELPGDFFDQAFDPDVTLFSANCYPPQPDPDPTLVLLPGHPDSGVLTMLHQRGSYEGLQVLRLDGSWTTVPVVEEAFVINIGELMSRWTNGRWPATVHRVVAGRKPADRRSSIAMFFLPRLDEVIAPLPTTTADEEARYEPISVYEWQQQFMEQYVLSRYDWDAGAPVVVGR